MENKDTGAACGVTHGQMIRPLPCDFSYAGMRFFVNTSLGRSFVLFTNQTTNANAADPAYASLPKLQRQLA